MAVNELKSMDDIVDYRTLTPAQLLLVKRTLELEQQYGKNNVYLRYIPKKRGTRFIIHFYGNTDFREIAGSNINYKIITSLLDKGLALMCDTLHRQVTDAEACKQLQDAQYLGVLIRTGCVNWWAIR